MSEKREKKERKRTAIVIMTAEKGKVLSLDWIWLAVDARHGNERCPVGFWVCSGLIMAGL